MSTLITFISHNYTFWKKIVDNVIQFSEKACFLYELQIPWAESVAS